MRLAVPRRGQFDGWVLPQHTEVPARRPGHGTREPDVHCATRDAANSYPQPASADRHSEAEWGEVPGLYLDTAHLAGRWANGEVDVEQVLRTTGPIVDRLGPLVDRGEAILAEVYGVDVAPLEAQRRQALEDIQHMPLGS